MEVSLKKKTVLITGATGFIGSHLVKRLLEEDSKVNIFLRNNSDIFRIKSVAHKLERWYGNIENYRSVFNCIKELKPEIVYHLAAHGNVERNLQLTDRMIDVNIRGTMNLLRAIEEAEIEILSFINTGTCEEYGNGQTPFIESQKEIPVSPYSASKVAATYFCDMTFRTMKLPALTLRPFLTYGPYQDVHMFIPSLIHHCLIGKDFAMTTGDQTREFNFVDDIVEGFILAAKCKNAIGEVINIGNGEELRIIDVAKKILKLMKADIRLSIGVLPKRIGEASHFFCNNKKAKRILGWEAKTSLNSGLEKTINWYRDNYQFGFKNI